jgi:hypothetical protein
MSQMRDVPVGSAGSVERAVNRSPVCVAEQVGEVRANPPRQGVDRIPPVAFGLANGVGNVMAHQRLLCPP